jgi:hypothetical protein
VVLVLNDGRPASILSRSPLLLFIYQAAGGRAPGAVDWGKNCGACSTRVRLRYRVGVVLTYYSP